MKTGDVLEEMTATIENRRAKLSGDLRFHRSPSVLTENSLTISSSNLISQETNAFPQVTDERFDKDVGREAVSHFATSIDDGDENSPPVRIQASSVGNAGVSGIIKPTFDRKDRFGFLLEPISKNERKGQVIDEVETQIIRLFSGGDQ
ncbi:hypothetical protein [Natrarchaeobius halalkaliphilus]|uniref:hypothetical protein n=1 Tax=Natrarchaeobius halalkaliphilus TaxID=1679091 RepID=UPI000F52EFAC|nr:hypothetical protein [Natrarchaeobius halalkaliphilus]